MRVAISGGTGFVGTHLARALLDRGDEVTLLVRAATNRGSVDPRAKTASIDSPPDLDAIVNLAGAGVLDERWTDERKRVFVSASAIGYYGLRNDDAELDESSAPGDDFLARLCVDWEAAARGARGRVAIARIGIVLGAGGGAMQRMVPMFRRFAGGPIGSGKQWWSWIHVDDLVAALLFAIDGNLEGPLNATAPAPATMNEVAAELGRALHRPAVLRAPAFALRLAMGERAEVLLTGQRVIPMRLLGAGFEFRYPELKSAIESAI